MSERRDEGLGLGKALGRATVPADVQRRIVVGALDRLEQPRARLAPWALVAAGAAAALAVGVWRFSGGARTPEAGTLVATTEATTYALGPHRVELAAASRLRFTAVEPGAVQLELEAGRAHFRVAKLRGGEHFRVRGAAATVEVVGTRFDVEAVGACTRVRVQEGQVRVTPVGQGAEALTPGQERTVCPPAGPEVLSAEEKLVREALGLISSERELPRAAELLERYRRDYAGGVFEEEALFYLCLTRARLGQGGEARALREAFLARFPQSSRGQRLRELSLP